MNFIINRKLNIDFQTELCEKNQNYLDTLFEVYRLF